MAHTRTHSSMRLGKVYEYSGKDRSEAELARFLDGAWEKAESGPVPPPYSALYVHWLLRLRGIEGGEEGVPIDDSRLLCPGAATSTRRASLSSMTRSARAFRHVPLPTIEVALV